MMWLPTSLKRVRATPGRVGGNDQRGDARRAALRRSRPREDDEGVGAIGEGDRRLLPVEDVMAAVAAASQLQRRGVRSAAGLGHANAHQGLAA